MFFIHTYTGFVISRKQREQGKSEGTGLAAEQTPGRSRSGAREKQTNLRTSRGVGGHREK